MLILYQTVRDMDTVLILKVDNK